MFHAKAGRLPSEDPSSVIGVRLPPGRPLASHESDSPFAWLCESVPVRDASNLIRVLATRFGETGLWPVYLSGDVANWEFEPGPRPGDRRMDALEVFRDGDSENAQYREDDDDESAPPRFTVPADPSPGPDLAADGLEVQDDGPGNLLLVPVDRPADVPRAIGWSGAANRELVGGALGTTTYPGSTRPAEAVFYRVGTESSPGVHHIDPEASGATTYRLVGEPMSAVLRSWEDRFGATLVAMTLDTLSLQVPRPPTHLEQARALATEHYAFCPDNIDQGMAYAHYVHHLQRSEHWTFWWD